MYKDSKVEIICLNIDGSVNLVNLVDYFMRIFVWLSHVYGMKTGGRSALAKSVPRLVIDNV